MGPRNVNLRRTTTMTERNGFPMRHLGDGVYASFDGYQMWLHVNSHEATPVVAIEAGVLNELVQYWRDVHKDPAPGNMMNVPGSS